ncbi:hypothetical protein P152DRAFT_15509 [Eremomyces bilateralis CBS 781.70]|uniref:Uncharacterized protein n=1 Tax=Eremomyces bilateralis CBS 781.70 TaxID=1392243 RepID=A0A6G1GH66_9PEZI|nr:uncharacterized protein P152DRAFT_15509 [Eremomyces bilateralis CBS 781.70]KAF1817332.1 hypothetical protein P152DRAFT_15509 [Eremomyces bilateralis CBS 781.70]
MSVFFIFGILRAWGSPGIYKKCGQSGTHDSRLTRVSHAHLLQRCRRRTAVTLSRTRVEERERIRGPPRPEKQRFMIDRHARQCGQSRQTQNSGSNPQQDPSLALSMGGSLRRAEMICGSSDPRFGESVLVPRKICGCSNAYTATVCELNP